MSILWWPKSRNDKLCDGYGVLDVCGSMWDQSGMCTSNNTENMIEEND